MSTLIGVQKPVFYALAALVSLGTLYSVAYSTYLDTSNPLLTHLPHPLASTHYFASKGNFLNVFFIKKAWGWTTAVFLFSWLTSPAAQRGGRSSSRRLATYLFLTAWWILFTSWFFGPAILERVLVASGGECILPGPANTLITVPNDYCFQQAHISPTSHPELFQQFISLEASSIDGKESAPLGVWESIKGVPRLRKGHDVSGHIFLLTMSILLLTEQLQASLHVEQRNWTQVHRISVIVNALMVGIWLWASAVTAVYFHSPMEKVTGFRECLVVLFDQDVNPDCLCSTSPRIRSICGDTTSLHFLHPHCRDLANT